MSAAAADRPRNEHWCSFTPAGTVQCRCGWTGTIDASYRHLAQHDPRR